MDFVVIDFETANASRDSACALGIVVVKDNKIIEEKDWLIRPNNLEFDPWNSMINGITEDDVKDKPKFNELWIDIKPYLENQLVIAHNASFDISVLRNTLDCYNIKYPNFTYSCTRIISKQYYKGLVNYKLNTIAKHLGIEFKHHIASEDAKATAKILIRICKELNVSTIDELNKHLELKSGSVFEDGYKPACKKSKAGSNVDISQIKSELDNFDESHPYFKRTIVFTGKLTSMKRQDAMQRVVNVGGLVSNGITKKTNYLVIGIQDYSKFADGEKSSKLKKAEELIEKGQNLEIISEEEFLQML